MDRLENGIQRYAWGSREAIATLQGRPASAEPEAELWMGAHPQLPSHVTRGDLRRSLRDWVAEAPTRELGPAVAAAFGELPFLLKVLAAEEPLSLQAHPSAAQAAAGFAREDAEGIPRDAPQRSYRDPRHKPELLCALTPMDALCGFRAPGETARLFRGLGAPAKLVALLDAGDLRAVFGDLLARDRGDRAELVSHMVAACAAPPPGFERECAWAVRLAAKYPGDVGVVSALLLNLLTLAPGEALFLDAGNLHAYLHGVGVELMAASDNVLRGGLTQKHMDERELLAVLDFSPIEARPVPVLQTSAEERTYRTPAREFCLSRLDVAGHEVRRVLDGPEIWLATRGDARLQSARGELVLRQGEAAFLSPDDGFVSAHPVLAEGAVLYRARVAP